MDRRRFCQTLSAAVPSLWAARWLHAHDIKGEPVNDVKAVATGNNEFACDLFAKLRGAGGNLFYSPTSLSTALAMVAAGAAGDTAQEMMNVLHFTLPPDRRNAAYGQFSKLLQTTGGNYQLAIANALWTQKGFPLKPAFLEVMKRDYEAGENAVDFKTAVEEARLAINRWVEERTKDKIKNLIAQGALTPDVRLVVTNAIYFKADWLVPFDANSTHPREFETAPGKTLKVNMMHNRPFARYAENALMQMLEMPYVGRDLAMLFILPKARLQLAKVEAELTASNLEKWQTGLTQQKVVVALPKYRMDTAFELGAVLSKMGMAKAFSQSQADFSGMASVPGEPLYIGQVIHKAFVAVDEKGTEAAAATAITMRAGSAMPPEKPKEFIADQPFLCAIKDQRTGAILFMGRVSEPTAA